MTLPLILASASPRRMELLRQIGVSCKSCPVDIDESVLLNERPEDYVKRVAAHKSEACGLQMADCNLNILAADTSVICEGQILGKPCDQPHALAMLQQLSGKTHQVLTAVSLRSYRNARCECHDMALSVTDVTFRTLSASDLEAYWATGEPLDKAGAYAIQGYAAIFIESIRGSYSGVVGLPLFETANLLSRQGIFVIS